MDSDLINLMRNSISNDYCKLACSNVIEEENEFDKNLYAT